MAKRKKSKARRKTKRGLGCGPGPVSGDCRFDRPLAGFRGLRGRGPIISLRGRGFGSSLRGGLRGTASEHASRAEGLIGRAETIQRKGDFATEDCTDRLERNLSVLSMATRAEAEASWVSGEKGKRLDRAATQLAELAWRNIKTLSCKGR